LQILNVHELKLKTKIKDYFSCDDSLFNWKIEDVTKSKSKSIKKNSFDFLG